MTSIHRQDVQALLDPQPGADPVSDRELDRMATVLSDCRDDHLSPDGSRTDPTAAAVPGPAGKPLNPHNPETVGRAWSGWKPSEGFS